MKESQINQQGGGDPILTAHRFNNMHFIIETNPVPKARPRVTCRGTYTPKRTKDAMEKIKEVIEEHPDCPDKPLSGPVSVIMTFYVPMPKSWSKKKRGEMLAEPVAKKQFDIDNLEKTVYDALNGILWEDDGQIWKHTVKKVWSNTGRIELQIV